MFISEGTMDNGKQIFLTSFKDSSLVWLQTSSNDKENQFKILTGYVHFEHCVQPSWDMLYLLVREILKVHSMAHLDG